MSKPQLSRLERVDLRNIWQTEASDFTPWLAQDENLEILGDTLGLTLELEAQERSVGPFRADILCKDRGADTWVLIENQLEKTDHIHLGQLLTYAAGLEAVTIVWISSRFVEEHRATLDWLNKITDDRFRFFGLEVELWRIAESPPAPKFNVVSKPNNWSRSVAEAARAIDETALSETQALQLEYWTAFHPVLDNAGGPISGNRKPQPQSWMGYSIGRSRFLVSAVMIRPQRQIRAELYLSGPDAKAYFGLLEQQKTDIESELQHPMVWEELPDKQDSRIAVYLEDADPENQNDWPRQHEWLATKVNELHRVFAPKVRDLNASDWLPEKD